MKSICGANCEKCYFKGNCKGCCETDGSPFGGSCILAERCKGCKENVELMVDELKSELIHEINSVRMDGCPRITDLTAFNGFLINSEIQTSLGKVKYFKDENVYLGTELKLDEKRRIGVAVDEHVILMTTYEEGSTEHKLLLYRVREIK